MATSKTIATRYRVVLPAGPNGTRGTVLTTISAKSATEQKARLLGGKDCEILIEQIAPVGCYGSGITDGAVLWSDGRSSAAWEFGAADLPPRLPELASLLLSTIRGSDGSSCKSVGGPLVVAAVVDCVTTPRAHDPRPTRGGYQSPIVDQLDVTLADGSRRTWYAASVGYPEGYLYELTDSYDTAVAALADHDAQFEAIA